MEPFYGVLTKGHSDRFSVVHLDSGSLWAALGRDVKSLYTPGAEEKKRGWMALKPHL